MGRASKPNVPSKSPGDQHYATEVNATDTAIDAVIDDYVSQSDTAEQSISSDFNIAAKKLKTTNLLIKEVAATELAVRNAADTAYRNIVLETFYPTIGIKADYAGDSDELFIQTKGVATSSWNFNSYTGAGWNTTAKLKGGYFNLYYGRLQGALNANQKEIDEMLFDKGTSYPTDPAPVDGQPFYRTDLDKLYIYDGSTWDDVSEVPGSHDLGGSAHTADTLADLNTKISDATLLDTTAIQFKTGSLHVASEHESGGSLELTGSLAVKLDDLASPEDNVDLNSSTSAHGLLKKLDNNADHYMDGTGNWTSPAAGGSHDLGGALHDADTLANLNSKVSDATLDTSTGTCARTPPSHALGTAHSADTLANVNNKLSDATLLSQDAIQFKTGSLHVASDHESGGSLAVKLDDLDTPDDNADLNSTTGHHGLLRKLDGITTNFMRGDGTWAQPSGTGVYRLLAAYLVYYDSPNWKAMAPDGSIDYSSSQLATVLNNALNATKGKIYVQRASTMSLNATVTIPEDRELEFEKGCKVTPSSNIDMIKIEPSGWLTGGRFDTSGISFSKRVIYLDGADPGWDSTYKGYYFPHGPTGARDIYLHGDSGTGTGTGIELVCDDGTAEGEEYENITWTHFENLKIRNFEYGIHLKNVSPSGKSWINQNSFYGVYLRNNVYGLYVYQNNSIAAVETTGNQFSNISYNKLGSTNTAIWCNGKNNRFTGYIWDTGSPTWGLVFGSGARKNIFIGSIDYGRISDDPSYGNIIIDSEYRTTQLNANNFNLREASTSAGAGGTATWLNINVNGTDYKIPLQV